jgi:aconitate hydratase 2/2-methylisocitrate dehydratase
VVHQQAGSAGELTITVFKVPGETNTDDLSPAPDATTRPDIPLHALAMLKNKRPTRRSCPKKTASAARSRRS